MIYTTKNKGIQLDQLKRMTPQQLSNSQNTKQKNLISQFEEQPLKPLLKNIQDNGCHIQNKAGQDNNDSLNYKKRQQLKKRRVQQRPRLINNMNEHLVSIQQLLSRYGTNIKTGLTTQVAIRRQKTQGFNIFPYNKKTPKWIKFIKQLTNSSAILLWISTILSIVTYILQPSLNQTNIYLAIILIIVIIITGVINFIHQSQSQGQISTIQQFQNIIPSSSKCLRDGLFSYIPTSNLVRGDIIEIMSGQKIPADIRIIQSLQMKVDNSFLTGQIQSFPRTAQCTNINPLQTANLAFFGCLCTYGRGRGVLINIGSHTAISQNFNLPTEEECRRKSPLRIELDRFVLVVSICSIILVIVLSIIALFFVKYTVLECIIFGIGIFIANIPQGLFACISISLAITAKGLSQKSVLVKNLKVIETLGCVTCIISDKTGAITRNKLTVKHLWFDGKLFPSDTKQTEGKYDVQAPSFNRLHCAAILCTQAQFDVNESMLSDPNFSYANALVLGDASQAALIRYFQPIQNINLTKYRYQSVIIEDQYIYKNSQNKFIFSIVKQEGYDHHYVAYIKGVPAKIFKQCGKILLKGNTKEISQEDIQKFNEVNFNLCKNGQKVLGFAMIQLPKQKYNQNYSFKTANLNLTDFLKQNIIFIGLISMKDPPKQSVPLAIQKCLSGGIKVVMITGGQTKIAAAIAKQIGLMTLKTNEDLQEQGYSHSQALEKANAVVIHGDMINKAFQDGEQVGREVLQSWLKKLQIIFARINPIHKLQIVKACQAIGHIVCITGDGVGDSPAVKQADIGISLGVSGSDITKDAADMILLDDDFSSIVHGIQQGRKSFDNLKKTILYLLTSNTAQIWPFIAFIILQIPLPLSNIFILVISVGTDIYPALALAYQQPQFDVMTRKPRKPTDRLITTRLIVHAYCQMGSIATAGGFFTYFTVMQVFGFSPSILIKLLSIPAVNPIIDGVINNQSNNVYNYSLNSFPIGLDFINDSTIIPYNNPYIPIFASNATINKDFPSWLSSINTMYDLRGFYLQNCGLGISGSINGYCQKFQWPEADQSIISAITGQRVAYTTQSIFYAQSAYFVTIIMVQWSTIFACKSRRISFTFTKFNGHIFGGIALETCIFIFLLYCPGVNRLVGGRPLPFFLLGIPGLAFSMIILIWEQACKFLINMNTKNWQIKW